MKCVTENEIQTWLESRSIPKQRYQSSSAPEFYLQFYAPQNHTKLDAFIREYYRLIVLNCDSLVQITDWSLYQQSEMIAVDGIRSSHGEDRTLIDAPGHSLGPNEAEIGISLFSLSASYGWSSYLYASLNHSTLYNWEGDIFDFWTDSEEMLQEMNLILKQFELSETTEGK